MIITNTEQRLEIRIRNLAVSTLIGGIQNKGYWENFGENGILAYKLAIHVP